MPHVIRILKQSNGYHIAVCSCGWRYGPDTPYQTGEKTDEHREENKR